MMKLMLLLSITILKILAEETSPEVETDLGKIRGYYTTSASGRQYAAFEGIPYAKPPVGELRFQDPKPIEQWKGTWIANTLYKCIQYNHYTEPTEDFVIGDEDCLYLNIYTPHLDKNLDVIIYIHGGAFMFNHGGSYGPKIIMDRDVVFVTLNYRLGPLGFLSTENEIVPGNNGLKDQLLALKWIKRHIRAFGGNPDSITLTGMSAGGASAQIHYLSPLVEEGLFHRGISQSGSALNPWVLVENSLEKARTIGEKLGCPLKLKEMIDCLKTRPARQIVNSVKYFLPWLYNPFSPFGVVIDKWSDNPILPKHPIELLKSGNLKNIPWIFSSVESEGLYPAADFLAEERFLNEINEKWNELIPFILDYNNTVDPSLLNDISEEIREFYFKGKPVTKNTFPQLVKVITDRLFLVDIENAARLQASKSDSPVYYYKFSYRGAHSKSELRSRSNENYGASHGDDTVYVLSSNVDTQSTSRDRKMSQLLQELWVSYASDGKPVIPNVTWEPIRQEGGALKYLHIVSPEDISMKEVEELGNRSFWSNLPIKENLYLKNTKDEL